MIAKMRPMMSASSAADRARRLPDREARGSFGTEVVRPIWPASGAISARRRVAIDDGEHRQRIDTGAAEAHAPVKMGPRDAAGRAHFPDHLARFDALSFVHADHRHV